MNKDSLLCVIPIWQGDLAAFRTVLSFRHVDASIAAWHSRWMRNRYSTHRLAWCLVLSQVLALQAMILAWSGTQAIAGGPAGVFGVVCYGAASDREAGGTEPPIKPAGHQDCLGACVAGHAAAASPGQPTLCVNFSVYGRILMPTEAPLLERSGTQVFLARAPPMLT